MSILKKLDPKFVLGSFWWSLSFTCWTDGDLFIATHVLRTGECLGKPKKPTNTMWGSDETPGWLAIGDEILPSARYIYIYIYICIIGIIYMNPMWGSPFTNHNACHFCHFSCGCFPKIVVPHNGWWKSWKTWLKWMIRGENPTIFGNAHVKIFSIPKRLRCSPEDWALLSKGPADELADTVVRKTRVEQLVEQLKLIVSKRCVEWCFSLIFWWWFYG